MTYLVDMVDPTGKITLVTRVDPTSPYLTDRRFKGSPFCNEVHTGIGYASMKYPEHCGTKVYLAARN